MPSRHCLRLAEYAALLLAGAASNTLAQDRPRLNLAECGRLTAWPDERAAQGTTVESITALPAESRWIGVVWDEERDICELQLQLKDPAIAVDAEVQYWNRSWPPEPPHMPTIEDPIDDPWQGQWLTAAAVHAVTDGAVTWTFKPLAEDANDKAEHLPDVTYRRTLKIRLVLPEKAPRIESLRVFSPSALKPMSIRIELGCGDKHPVSLSGWLEIYNGQLLSAAPWQFGEDDAFEAPGSWKNLRTGSPKGIIANILATEPAPPGSNDITVVTVRTTAKTSDGDTPRTFSFSTLDLEQGPIHVPAMHAYVAQASDTATSAATRPSGEGKIRDRIPREAEQSRDRASREIPPLDPWHRQGGDRVYLPIAADASWQKFAVEYGGEIFISKSGTKAKGAELKRLQWDTDRIHYRIGTGEKPYFRDDHQAQVSIAENCLPIIINRWEHQGLQFEQEAFATLLSGPLDPNDVARSEQTPAICMVRLQVTNPGSQPKKATVWLTLSPEEHFSLHQGGMLATGTNDKSYQPHRLRAVIPPLQAPAARIRVASPDNLDRGQNSILAQFDVAPGKTEQLHVRIPFVSDIPTQQVDRLAAMDYTRERERVATYWRTIVDRTTRFTTPEPEFNSMARSVIPHIHISTTKDPKSGLFMVPAASYHYQVFANEACFQILLLDALGDTERATQYLRTLTQLQGTRPFPGNYTKPYDAVYHGAWVSREYDYTASSYGLDHGTVLWTLARHFFFTRDTRWLDATLPGMMRAVDWIESQRATTRLKNARGEKALEYGLLPAGHLEDNSDWGYWFAVNAYCAAGMTEMAAAMRAVQHPQADQLNRQANEYLNDFRTAILRATELAPVTRMRDRTYSPYVPTKLYQRFRGFGPLRVQYYSRYRRPDLPCYRLSATREVLYGPMILLNLGIFNPHQPIADWILDDWEDNLTLSSSGGFNVHGFTDDKYWFSQGGMVFQSNLQNPILVYLMRQEVPAAIRGLYNGMVSCLYPEVHAFTEEYRMWSHASGPFYKSPDEARFVNRVRDSLVLECGEDLWLANGAPRRWLTSKDGIQVERINSCFGPVSFTLRAGDQANTVVANVTPPTKARPKNLWLFARLPAGTKIKSVQIDGRPWMEFDPARERILIPDGNQPMKVLIQY
ncbi:MAG TPA: hypothetical protein PKY77_07130 [Phycisphaerae bacterium]|nr:hypothetical protein [Phycisphaerae bacterium]HRY67775.1 hypothetical protein [Phycisphaerae bacterium]HSA25227.1 hypothetical protein [Phycisphaerae bacterium]